MSISQPLHANIVFDSDRVQDQPVLFLEITDVASLGNGNTIYLCSYPIVRISDVPLKYGAYSNGLLYEFAFTGIVPTQQESQDLMTTLVFDNLDQSWTSMFIALSADNLCRIFLALASDPDTQIRNFPNLRITAVQNTDQNLSIQFNKNRNIAGQSNATSEPWPSGIQNYNNAPGLFKQ